jgi:hypothetical protein
LQFYQINPAIEMAGNKNVLAGEIAPMEMEVVKYG